MKTKWLLLRKQLLLEPRWSNCWVPLHDTIQALWIISSLNDWNDGVLIIYQSKLAALGDLTTKRLRAIWTVSIRWSVEKMWNLYQKTRMKVRNCSTLCSKSCKPWQTQIDIVHLLLHWACLLATLGCFPTCCCQIPRNCTSACILGRDTIILKLVRMDYWHLKSLSRR